MSPFAIMLILFSAPSLPPAPAQDPAAPRAPYVPLSRTWPYK